MAEEWNLYDLDPPTQWMCAELGAERKPAYFDCAGCDTKEPVIAGFIGTGPTFADVGVTKTSDGMFKTAMYCETCWPIEKAKYLGKVEEAARLAADEFAGKFLQGDSDVEPVGIMGAS